MVWSSDSPKQAGMYWARNREHDREIVELTGQPEHLKQMFRGLWIELHNLPRIGWEWAGPIPEPQEQPKDNT